MNPYTSLCDDFGVYAYLNTKLELPQGREAVLHFFDSLQKTFPKMTEFERRDSGEYVLEEEALDTLFVFDFAYAGNHDEVVAEALAPGSPLEALVQLPGSKVLNFEPAVMLSLDEQCRLQARLSVETRTNAFQVRTGQFPEAPISVYFTVRQYWGRQPFKTLGESYQNQRRICQELVDSHVVPNVIRPLAQTIAAK
jgi:hypothetical protein